MTDIFLHNMSSPVGDLTMIADEQNLLVVDFAEKSNSLKKLPSFNDSLRFHMRSNQILDWAASELESYFSGKLRDFSVPVRFIGTDFQIKVWKALCSIPFGAKKSYKEIAAEILQPDAVRAVGNANSINRIPIIVPCHRVVNHSGDIGGYAGGVERKRWLLEHEEGV